MTDDNDGELTLKQRIARKVTGFDHVTFAELTRLKGVDGGLGLVLRDPVRNIETVLWSGLSTEALDAIEELCREKVIAMTECTTLVYFVDGAVPQLPVLTKAAMRKKRRVKTGVYWAPVQFRPYHRVKPGDRLDIFGSK